MDNNFVCKLLIVRATHCIHVFGQGWLLFIDVYDKIFVCYRPNLTWQALAA